MSTRTQKSGKKNKNKTKQKNAHKLSGQLHATIDLVCCDFKRILLKICDLYVTIYTALIYDFKGDQFKA